MANWIAPPWIAVGPLKPLEPVSVSVPLPSFVKASVPGPSWSEPANVELATDELESVSEPAAAGTIRPSAEPASVPISRLPPPSTSEPLVTVTGPVAEIACGTASTSPPPAISVPPE